ncbi:hypothetical protein C1H46_005625 [Malus baccata]|uniref:Uncharacterized protein n=1 Tax=Malus baccata TaxID=106549 RepID=A0A540NCL1_MALBA|nr:hypothetical protein C1H46_005625 [Malus baccata]
MLPLSLLIIWSSPLRYIVNNHEALLLGMGKPLKGVRLPSSAVQLAALNKFRGIESLHKELENGIPPLKELENGIPPLKKLENGILPLKELEIIELIQSKT